MGTPTFLFQGSNIDKLHGEITRTIVQHGRDIVFGFERKKAREIHATVHIYGVAIKRLLNGSTPKKFSWSGVKIKIFMKMGIAANCNQYGHDYTYQQLLREWKSVTDNKVINQLKEMRTLLSDSNWHGVDNNGIIAVLYDPSFIHMVNKPCCNWIQLRMVGEKKVSIRILFRSHDYGSAYWANLAFFLYLIRTFVTDMDGFEIVEVILTSTSAHIYENDQDLASKTTGIPWDKFDWIGLLKFWK